MKYDLEYQKFLNDQDNDAIDLSIKLKRNYTFYLRKASEKLTFLRDEARDPFMSRHNLGRDFRKGFLICIIMKYL